MTFALTVQPCLDSTCNPSGSAWVVPLSPAVIVSLWPTSGLHNLGAVNLLNLGAKHGFSQEHVKECTAGWR